MTTQQVGLHYVPLGDLRGWKSNPKGHDIESLCHSLRRFGFIQPLVQDEDVERLVAGHGRLAALLQLKEAGEAPPARILDEGGDWLVPVLTGIAFETEDEAEAYLLADNQLTIAGGWRENDLGESLSRLTKAGVDVGRIGFSGPDLAALTGDVRMPGAKPEERTFTANANAMVEIEVARERLPEVINELRVLAKRVGAKVTIV
jgi:hypothetical protein